METENKEFKTSPKLKERNEGRQEGRERKRDGGRKKESKITHVKLFLHVNLLTCQ